MRRCISEPTIRFPRPAPRSVATSAFTTPGALIRALTGRRQTMLTSLACRTSRHPEPGRRSPYQNRNAVQTNRATAGPIIPGDLQRLINIASSSTGPIVDIYLNSAGGEVAEGLGITDYIGGMGAATAVPTNGLCTSICAIIYFAGRAKYIG